MYHQISHYISTCASICALQSVKFAGPPNRTLNFDLCIRLRSVERMAAEMSFEPPPWICLCALPGTPEELAHVRKLVTRNTAIKLNFGKWVRSANSEYPPSSVVEKCKLWASEEWRPFRLALSKPPVIAKVDISGEKLAILTLNEMGASPSLLEQLTLATRKTLWEKWGISCSVVPGASLLALQTLLLLRYALP